MGACEAQISFDTGNDLLCVGKRKVANAGFQVCAVHSARFS